MMDDPNITMKEYIRLEEEKSQKHGKVFNWETGKYGKIWYHEDIHDLRYVETEFLDIVFNDNLTSIETLFCEPKVSSLSDNEIDFRISFDQFDDEDYMIWHLYHLAIRDTCGFVIRWWDTPRHLVYDFKQRLKTIFARQEFILEFFSTCRIGDEIGLDVVGTLCFQLGGARRSMTWRELILALGLHTAKEMAEDGFGVYWDFLRGAPSYTYIRDPVRRLCAAFLRGDRHLKRHAEGRKSSARLSGSHFIGRLAYHFGLVSDDGLRGLSVVARKLPLIDMVDKGAQADPTPIQAPQPPPPPPVAGRTMP
ncbi:hypothetical protein Tco_0907199 [Tanacetum coccineum]|uniref:Uncharacterized protein n=1 Tax=Tanacetum coccineum TaxID=301880 RepID=A0ABQ5CPY2_9ASTR